ncbi:MAG: peptidylprolyl isomerase [Candidatus Kapabacteria bacterium]|nr:peptidylprolyl isomerase [Candidatus Kapabacteria bacterium]
MKKFMFLFTAMFAIFAVNNSFSQADEGKAKMPNPRYEITVTQTGKELGKILIELYANEAPKHTANFDSLVTAGAFNGTAFHRVIPGFMIQGGDPNSINKPKETWGYGDPAQTRVPAEFSKTLKHKRGIISAARSQDPNSAASQFFICVADAFFLDGQYSIYGEVVEGMDVADKIVALPRDPRDNPLEKVEMTITKVK